MDNERLEKELENSKENVYNVKKVLEDEIETMPIVHYQNLKLRDYNKEPNNWTYFFGKVLAVLGGALILFMILFLTNVI